MWWKHWVAFYCISVLLSWVSELLLTANSLLVVLFGFWPKSDGWWVGQHVQSEPLWTAVVAAAASPEQHREVKLLWHLPPGEPWCRGRTEGTLVLVQTPARPSECGCLQGQRSAFSCHKCVTRQIGTNTGLMEDIAQGEIGILFFWILHFAKSCS